MKRSALKRTTRLRPRRPTPRRSERVVDEAFLAFVRTLPCASCGDELGVQAHHAGPHPLGRKASDDTAIPLDGPCHGALHDGRAKFADQPRRRRWEALVIEATRSLYADWQAARRVGTMELSMWALVRYQQAWVKSEKEET